LVAVQRSQPDFDGFCVSICVSTRVATLAGDGREVNDSHRDIHAACTPRDELTGSGKGFTLP